MDMSNIYEVDDIYEISAEIYKSHEEELYAIFGQIRKEVDQRVRDNAIARNLIIMLICDTIETDGLVIMSPS